MGTALQLWCAGLSLQWLLDLWRTGSQAHWLQWLQLKGSAAPWHVGSAQTRHQTCVPCTGRQLLTTELPAKSNTPIFTGTARVKFQPTISQLDCITWAPLFSSPSPLKCVTYLGGPRGAEPNGHLTALAYFRSKVIRYSSIIDSIMEDVWWCYVLQGSKWKIAHSPKLTLKFSSTIHKVLNKWCSIWYRNPHTQWNLRITELGPKQITKRKTVNHTSDKGLISKT